MPVISHLVDLATRSSDTTSSSSTVLKAPLSTSSFTIDSSGVAGFFGGEGAVRTMATVYLIPYRRWAGWYNPPGAYESAKRYAHLANTSSRAALFPGIQRDPAEFFGLDGQTGPPFLAARSGTRFLHTGHLARTVALLALGLDGVYKIVGRRTVPREIMVIDLPHAPPETLQPETNRWPWSALLVICIPIIASFSTCVVCALVGDWWCFSSIALGILANGIACLVIGSGTLTFHCPQAPVGAPRGDGVLVDDGQLIVLRGEATAVNAITRGSFRLQYSGYPQYRSIQYSSLLLSIQFLAQLLLVPQGQLIGQILFLTSLGVSFTYHAYVSSWNLERSQANILLTDLLRSKTYKFILGTLTVRTVFMCLCLQPNDSHSDPIRNPRMFLDELIPNHTAVWNTWKTLVAQKLSINAAVHFTETDWLVSDLGEEDRKLLGTLLRDAEDAYEIWRDVFPQPPAL